MVVVFVDGAGRRLRTEGSFRSGTLRRPEVEVASVIQKDVPGSGVSGVGTLEGYVNAQISPQVSGYLIRQDYHEGGFVKGSSAL